jgi:lipoate-protein ligase A
VIGAGSSGCEAGVTASESDAIIIERSLEPSSAAAQLAIEQTLFDVAARVPQRLRLWQPLPALIVTLAEANRPGFAPAAARAEARSLAVHVRASGGGAVCLGPGSLVVSHLYDSPRNDIDASYRRFAGALTAAVAALGVSLTVEHVVGAYCDGRFDLVWHGLKVGGIAQRRRVQHGGARVWIHAVLAVEARSLAYPEAVTEFYANLGSPRVADPRATTTLSHCFDGHRDPQDLVSRISDAIVQAFDAPGRSAESEPATRST